MLLLTYQAPKFSAHQLEILARHMPSTWAFASPAYGEFSFNALSNALRAIAEGHYNVSALYEQDYR